MADTSTSTQTPELEPASPLTPAASPESKGAHGHHNKQVHHHHREPRIIRPASSSTTHLDPGAVMIKP
jgi:hypothetical protein